MKSTTVLCVLATVGFTIVVAAPSRSQYTDRYDSINIDHIINNKRLLLPYIMCVLEKGKCSPEGKELKSHIREALETFCEKCTSVQRNATRRVIAHLINNEASYWTDLTNKYDPSRKYVVRYENELRQVKI